MKIRSVLALLLLALQLASCAPARNQPVFSLRDLPAATSIPTPAHPRLVATLAQRISAFDVSPADSAGSAVIALATGAGVKLYDLRTYKFLRSLNDTELSSSVAWSPDGSKLAVGATKDYGVPFFVGGDSTNSAKAHLTVWDTSTWKVVFEPEFGNEMVNQQFSDMAWSPDGRSLAFSLDLGGVQVLDTLTGRTISRQADFAATVTDLSWSPDGTRLVATHDLAYGIRRWRLSDNKSVRLFDPRAGASFALAWSPDGQRIASGHTDGGVCFWTAATNQCDGFIHAHRSATFSLAWSPDGRRLATGGGVIRLWNSRSGRLLKSFGEDSNYIYNQLEWPAPNGPLISLETSFESPGSSVLRIWDPASGSVLAEFRGTQPSE
jgi:WD40 repeat protein